MEQAGFDRAHRTSEGFADFSKRQILCVTQQKRAASFRVEFGQSPIQRPTESFVVEALIGGPGAGSD